MDGHPVVVDLDLLAQIIVTPVHTVEFQFHELAVYAVGETGALHNVGYLLGEPEGRIVPEEGAVLPVGQKNPALMLLHAENRTLFTQFKSKRSLVIGPCCITPALDLRRDFEVLFTVRPFDADRRGTGCRVVRICRPPGLVLVVIFEILLRKAFRRNPHHRKSRVPGNQGVVDSLSSLTDRERDRLGSVNGSTGRDILPVRKQTLAGERIIERHVGEIRDGGHRNGDDAVIRIDIGREIQTLVRGRDIGDAESIAVRVHRNRGNPQHAVPDDG